MDVLTLTFVNVFIAVTFTILLSLQYKNERHLRYQRYFILAAVCMLVNGILSVISFSTQLLPYFLTPALSNASSVGAHLALACGIHRHLQLPGKRQWLLLGLVVVYLAQLSDFASVAAANRMLLAIPLVILLNLWSIRMLWRQRQSELGRVYLAFCGVFAFNILQFSLRSMYMLAEHFELVHTHYSALVHSIGYFSLTAFAILVFGCVIMLSHSQQRLALLHISERDALTGLLNRRSLHPRLQAELNRTERQNTTLSILLFDIDYFKQVNDTFGHKTGDKAIQHVVDIACNQLRDYDLLFRYGGEEFLICLPDTSEETAMLIANRLRKAVEVSPLTTEQTIKMTVSIGVACTDNATEPDELIEQADTALYRAKQGGRNTVVNFHQL